MIVHELLAADNTPLTFQFNYFAPSHLFYRSFNIQQNVQKKFSTVYLCEQCFHLLTLSHQRPMFVCKKSDSRFLKNIISMKKTFIQLPGMVVNVLQTWWSF